MDRSVAEFLAMTDLCRLFVGQFLNIRWKEFDMFLFNRVVTTSGDMEMLMPIVTELIGIIKKEADVNANAWVGSNGFVTGTLGFSIAYESLAARATATAKLGASKAWWACNRKLREHILGMEPDTIFNYIRGGTMGTAIPIGTVVQQNQFQLVQGADWGATIRWAHEYADLCKKLTGVDTNILHSLYGVLGGVGMLTGFANAAAVDEYRSKLIASTEYLPKFLEGGQFAMAGTVMQRHLVKIA